MEEKFNLNVQTENGEVLFVMVKPMTYFNITDLDMNLVALNHLLKV